MFQKAKSSEMMKYLLSTGSATWLFSLQQTKNSLKDDRQRFCTF